MPVTDITTTLQEQVLDSVKTAQDIALDAIKAWTETVPSVVPVPAEVSNAADQAFEFASKLLASQREFTGKILETVSA